MTDYKKISDQVLFCSVLMGRIKADIENAQQDSFGKISRYTAMQNDIIRLRRELNDLREMLNPYSVER